MLTAFHNVVGCGRLEVRGLDPEGGTTWLAAEVLWPEAAPDLDREPQADAALVRIAEGSWVPPDGEPVRWGHIDGGVSRSASESQLACLAVGFPRSERRDGVRDTKEIRGHIETLTGLKSGGLITAYVDRVAVPSKPDERSRWAGASGAALFARGRLIGVVTTDRQRDYDANQLSAVSVMSLAARPGFAIAVKAAGSDLVPEDVTAADPEQARTAYDVEVPRGVNNLPDLSSPIFVGRAEVMAELERALGADSQTLHGLGGVGKTTLALHYAHDHAGAYRLVWWIRSDTPELIEAGFAALTVRLRGGAASDLTTAQAAEWAVGWLQTHPGWLLVFDNAEKPEDVHAWSGQLRSSGRHLITSRYRRGWVSDPITLPVLDDEAALALLSRLTEGGGEDEARMLADGLGHLPLALQQAGAFIAQTEITFADYRAMLRRYPERTTDAAPGGSDPARTVARIWRITLDALQERDPRAVDILRIAAWYAPTGIPRDLFAPLSEDPVDLAQLLGLLADYNMITLDRAGVGIHRLLQKVARTPAEYDPHRDRDRITAARDRAVELMLGELPEHPDVNVAGWPTWRTLIPHVEALLDASEPGEDAAEIDLVLIFAGQFLVGQGQLSRATDYLDHSLAVATRQFGNSHRRTLGSRNNLAFLYVSAGDLERAIPLFERTLDDCVRVLGEDDPDTLASRNNLAGAYESAGDLVRAIPLFEQTLADRMRVLGEDDPDTLASRNNLAHAYESAGDLVRAIPLYEQTLADRLRVLREDHPDTLASRNYLAGAYESAGDLVRAIPLYEQTLADRLRVLGEDNPGTLASRNNLAGAYAAAGDLERAIPLYEQTLAECLRVLREDHPTTIGVRLNLFAALELQLRPTTPPAPTPLPTAPPPQTEP
ncbi:tetratricopeptide repeat protein [Streptomyces fulvoviolaceus]|uniref:tetratricopeptide repeat protein n=1 Tax=Streptomyces fulvoviolaceus TaxID=285535 RepID=UPI0021C11153|nr:tetratricopeptide repeat protein [Streptomyces fulvoviolaceus]MCT9076925.1 tetratricopeptide repeat protein [Streptomyces fulvoviolaceus]